MSRILILVGAHLCTSPRPVKEAEALASAGHDVIVRGYWYDEVLAERDKTLMAGLRWRFEPIIDFRACGLIGRWKSFSVRVNSKLAREKYLRFRKFTPSGLGYGTKAMLKAALKEHADLTIVHSEVGLWVGERLLDKGLRVGVDFEDWFSEDMLPEARNTRPVKQIKTLEQSLFKRCRYRLTTSNSLANAMAEAYGASKPTVIYNTFPLAERKHLDGETLDRRNTLLPSLHWFSQTIGPGRGLETLSESLNYLSIPAEIHLRGNCPENTRRWLTRRIPEEWRARVFIHPTVSNAELLSRIAEHDIGLALERNDIPSRDLTITNKLFQYLQAGLAVIATDTAGQREVFAKRPEIGILISGNDPKSLATAIESLLQDPNKLRAAKIAAIKAAQEEFCWEIQAQDILEAADQALALPATLSEPALDYSSSTKVIAR
jgi:glycosyltransferase involved in cell wall biosynthesis